MRWEEVRWGGGEVGRDKIRHTPRPHQRNMPSLTVCAHGFTRPVKNYASFGKTETAFFFFFQAWKLWEKWHFGPVFKSLGKVAFWAKVLESLGRAAFWAKVLKSLGIS